MAATSGLPIAWHVETASKAEVPVVPTLLDSLAARGFATAHAVMDKGYDGAPIYDECERRGIRPIIPLKATPAVVAGKHKPPSCKHGVWAFAGSDAKRGASKWRCSTGECKPASV